MLEQILERNNLLTAWKRVKENKGSPGVDGITIEEFPESIREHWPEIKRQLQEGSYRPKPVRRAEIPKRTGGKRPLGIPTVLDRFIQQAILQILQPLFDPGFSEWSHGFRPVRSCHQAVRRVRQLLDAGYQQVVDIDLSKFFDRVNHDLLMVRISRKVSDKRVLRLIGLYLRAGVEVEGKLLPTTEGVPQGGPMSPLLANIMLDDFDKELEKRGHRFVRYADDFMIFVRSKRAAQRVMDSVTRYLEIELKLVVNQQKSRIVKAEACEYLGFIFKSKRITWSDESLEEFKYNIRRLTARSSGISMKKRLAQLSRYIRGWMGYYALSKYYTPLPGFDNWIRRRVRMCYLKQWNRPRTQIRNLIKLGAPKLEAIGVGLSSKGPWRLAKTFGSQGGLTNAYLKAQGLVSVLDLWVAFHYPK
jgi:RNA-directed DNA polymerase